MGSVNSKKYSYMKVKKEWLLLDIIAIIIYIGSIIVVNEETFTYDAI